MKLTEKETEILEILDENSRVDAETIAKMANIPAEEVKSIIEKLEKEKVIIDYAAMIDWRKVDGLEGVTAMIDVKVTPKRNVGFDEVAERIYRFQEVESVYLMSGVYDLSVVIRGNTMSDVASFVSEKLSTLESVVSTTTHFILKKYKHDGKVFESGDDDKRIVVSP
ncbi:MULTISPECIES: Lrp/AsnC family transcriptional regulator [Bacillus]|jgi:DNA-binding Lrp family transcriptional regulator|nr:MULTISPECIES: Lrp/AsnC family transcriptional regulator [Bacillus]AIU75979.1 AsnC family transcriptional regulator [Bacillus subtilis]ARM28973.1 AsnC family transcriptional regulator [Bacillus vallismortis]UXZ17098.1 Lrp/AsnC family transcriptional regulator [Bacillus siamensis]COC72685.1 leucine-responsive transcriptional regulator [Streptococcus pneumoniae]SLC19018.1 leucine-responsive transcriptional regulator [Mycobacteroides abscessus subsp. massiliense]